MGLTGMDLCSVDECGVDLYLDLCVDLCGVVGMNGLDWDGEEEAEWLWLLPGGTPVGPEAASQTRTEL